MRLFCSAREKRKLVSIFVFARKKNRTFCFGCFNNKRQWSYRRHCIYLINCANRTNNKTSLAQEAGTVSVKTGSDQVEEMKRNRRNWGAWDSERIELNMIQILEGRQQRGNNKETGKSFSGGRWDGNHRRGNHWNTIRRFKLASDLATYATGLQFFRDRSSVGLGYFKRWPQENA